MQLASARQRWRSMEESFGAEIRSKASLLRKTLETDLRLMSSSEGPVVGGPNISAPCRVALGELLGALDELQLWAVRMVDSSAHNLLPSGLLEGTLTELGNFDECLSIRHEPPEAPTATLQSERGARWAPGKQQATLAGQYCTLLIKPPLIQRPRLHTACRRLPNLSSGASGAQQASGKPKLGSSASSNSSNANTNTNTAQSTANQEQFYLNTIAQNSQQFFYAGLRLGLCTPNACQRQDLQLLLSSYLAKYQLVGQIKSCQTLQTTSGGESSASAGLQLAPESGQHQELRSSGSEDWTMLSSLHSFDWFNHWLGLRLDLVQKCIV